MRLNDEARGLIAAQYVLGVLPAGVRRRFERMLESDPDCRADVEAWEGRIGMLGTLVPERIPSRSLRSRVLEGVSVDTGSAAAQRQRVSPLAALWGSLTLWRGVAMASLAAAVFFAVSATRPTAAPESNELADNVLPAMRSAGGATPVSYGDSDVLKGSGEAGVWLVKFDPIAGRLKVRVLETTTLSTGQAFELWLLPSGEGVPESLGLLPATDAGTLRVPGNLLPKIDIGRGLAVSLEPPGGSPTGLPTGPVVYSGALVEI